MISSPVQLTAKEVQRFHRNGFLGPFRLLAETEMQQTGNQILRSVRDVPGPYKKNPLTQRHLDQRTVYDLVTKPEILERIKAILGPDLLLWACTFWLKEPGGKEVPWHQDCNYWPMEPIINVTAWIAVDPVTPTNGCLELIPGSHSSCVPHIPAEKGKWFTMEADPGHVNASKAVKITLNPGEFILFNERVLHHSPVNATNTRRFVMGPRFTIPIVRIDHDKLFPGHRVIVVSGEDYMGFNQSTLPPG